MFLHAFSRAFQKYRFQICSFSHKKVIGYFKFFSQTGLFSALYPTLWIFKKIFFLTKNPLNYYSIKSHNFTPPPACLGLNKTMQKRGAWKGDCALCYEWYNGAKTAIRKHSFKSSAVNGRAKGGKKRETADMQIEKGEKSTFEIMN